MRWALRTLWACASGFRAYPPLVTATAKQLWHYLLTVILLTTLILSGAVCLALRQQMHALIAWVQALPTITIVEGTVTLAEPQPIRLERRDVAGVGDLLLIVDTTGHTTTVQEPGALSALLTAHELIVQQGRATRRYDLRGIKHLVVDDAWLAQWGRRLTWWFCGLIPLALFLYGLSARAAQALVWSSVAWAVYRLMNRPLAFPVIWRLALFAIGPPAVFASIVETLVMGQSQPLLWLIYLLIYAVLFNGALTATQRAMTAPPGAAL